MLQTKKNFLIDFKNQPYLCLNLVFGFFPISFIIGTFIVNLNLLVFTCLGIYYLKSKIITTKFDFSIKIIFLFFLLVVFSTSLSLGKNFYFEGYETIFSISDQSTSSIFSRFIKSILFLRFFLFLIIIYLLSKFDILNFKYFFLISAFASVFISLDIICQYFFGMNIIGMAASDVDPYYGKIALGKFSNRNSSFFGDEFIAGSYIQRFSFFAIFFTILMLKNNNYTKFIYPVILICILGVGILFSGNRMSFISFLFGLLLISFFNLKIKKILFAGFVALLILLQLVISSNDAYKDAYSSLYGKIKNIVTTPFKKIKGTFLLAKVKEGEIGEEKPMGQTTVFTKVRYQSSHKRLFTTALYTWSFNKIFGNGIKSFREDCAKIDEKDINLTEDLIYGKKNLLCSNHPHNYYLEILTEMGIVGVIIMLIIAWSFAVCVFRNFKLINKISFNNLIFLSAIISLILEVQPFKTTGSLFTTNNATYLILIGSIIINYRAILKIKVE